MKVEAFLRIVEKFENKPGDLSVKWTLSAEYV